MAMHFSRANGYGENKSTWSKIVLMSDLVFMIRIHGRDVVKCCGPIKITSLYSEPFVEHNLIQGTYIGMHD